MSEEAEKTRHDIMIGLLEQEFELQNEGKSDLAWIPEWVMGKEIETNEKIALMEKRLDELKGQAKAQLLLLKGHYKALFLDESQKMLAANKKGKSIKLMTGTIGYKKNPDKLDITDMDKALQWAIDNWSVEKVLDAASTVSLDKLKERYKTSRVKGTGHINWKQLLYCIDNLKKTPFKDHFINEGELPDGCDFTAGGDEFYSKPLKNQITKG